jgi:acyl-CoA thioesterase FadM
LRIDFREPLYIGEAAEIVGRVVHLSEAARTVTVNLRIEARGQIVASGSAEASFLSNG